jgi:predicted transcriptional regulator
MRSHDVGPLPVCQNNRLVGIITDRDLAVRGMAEGRDPSLTRVRDVMTSDVVSAYEDADVRDAARLMQERQVRRLVVINRDEQLTGIVSLGDLAAEIDDPEVMEETLRKVSESAAPKRLDEATRPAEPARGEGEPWPPTQRAAVDQPDPLLARAAADLPQTSRVFRLYKAGWLAACSVRNRDGDALGKLEDLVIDVEEGRIAYAVLSFGGVLGLGGKLFAIPLHALTLKPDEKVFILNVAKDKLERAPGFDKDNWPEMADRRWGSDIHSYYGYPPYWSKTV